jgi:hypothetical protein
MNLRIVRGTRFFNELLALTREMVTCSARMTWLHFSVPVTSFEVVEGGLGDSAVGTVHNLELIIVNLRGHNWLGLHFDSIIT